MPSPTILEVVDSLHRRNPNREGVKQCYEFISTRLSKSQQDQDALKALTETNGILTTADNVVASIGSSLHRDIYLQAKLWNKDINDESYGNLVASEEEQYKIFITSRAIVKEKERMDKSFRRQHKNQSYQLPLLNHSTTSTFATRSSYNGRRKQMTARRKLKTKHSPLPSDQDNIQHTVNDDGFNLNHMNSKMPSNGGCIPIKGFAELNLNNDTTSNLPPDVSHHHPPINDIPDSTQTSSAPVQTANARQTEKHGRLGKLHKTMRKKKEKKKEDEKKKSFKQEVDDLYAKMLEDYNTTTKNQGQNWSIKAAKAWIRTALAAVCYSVIFLY